MADDFDYGVHYAQFHNETDDHYEQYVAVATAQIEPYLPPGRNMEALDVGCGMGFAMGAMKRLGFSGVYGVDIDSSQIASARRRGLAVEQVKDVAAFLNANPGRFGFITMMDVFEHVPVAEHVATARSLYRALAPGGRLVMQVPNAASVAAPYWRHNDPTHTSSFTMFSLRPLLMMGGFERVEIPPTENTDPRPSLRPSRLFSKATVDQFRRWVVKAVWRQVLISQLGDVVRTMPLGLNLVAIADKSPEAS